MLAQAVKKKGVGCNLISGYKGPHEKTGCKHQQDLPLLLGLDPEKRNGNASHSISNIVKKKAARKIQGG